MWTKEEMHRWYYNSKLFRYCVYPLFLKFYYRFSDKLNYLLNKDEHDSALKEINEERAELAKDRNDAEMFQSWKENNPEEFKKWEENGKPDLFIY